MSRSMPELERHLEAVIRRRLGTAPAAADTVEGIAEFWIPGDDQGPDTLVTVERVLERLVAEGLVVRRVVAGGAVVFGPGCAGSGDGH